MTNTIDIRTKALDMILITILSAQDVVVAVPAVSTIGVNKPCLGRWLWLL